MLDTKVRYYIQVIDMVKKFTFDDENDDLLEDKNLANRLQNQSIQSFSTKNIKPKTKVKTKVKRNPSLEVLTIFFRNTCLYNIKLC